MYRVLLGKEEPPEEAIPAFIEDGASEVGNTIQQTREHMRLLRVRFTSSARLLID